MSFTKEQEAYIEKLAWNVGDEIAKRLIETLKDHVEREMQGHISKCLPRKIIKRAAWWLAGFAFAAGILTDGLIKTIMSAIK